jgi:OmpA-OmpF porin, OOP family
MKKIFILIAAIFCGLQITAQDVEGSKDHPMLSRMPGFFIYEYSSNFNAHTFPEKADDEMSGKSLEGQLTRIDYRYDRESGKPFPSPLQVLRNYSNAVTKLGGVKVTENINKNMPMFYVGKIKKDGKEIWVHVGEFFNVNDGQGSDAMGFLVNVMEIQEMAQEVTATDIIDALKSQGFIALNINFDTGKSTIRPESAPLIDQLAATLKSNTDLKVSIEGHTDNVGDAAANKKLSEQRAKAVMDAVIAKGIAAGRLSSVGWGQEKPVADNRTDAGRSQNRRVEIVKK